MTADHWRFVLAAYGLAALVFGLYWLHLCRRDHDLTAHENRSRKKSA